MTETCKEMIKNSVDVCINICSMYKHFVHVLPLKFIFVTKCPYPTHFKMFGVNTVGFEKLL